MQLFKQKTEELHHKLTDVVTNFIENNSSQDTAAITISALSSLFCMTVALGSAKKHQIRPLVKEMITEIERIWDMVHTNVQADTNKTH